MKKIVGVTAVYVLLYIVFMIPTYLLPYLGSNSSFINAASLGTNPLFWVHLAALLVLVALAWGRGSIVGKPWLIIFPILALIFDLIPGLNLVPLVPTVMHLLAIILGVVGSGAATIGVNKGAESSPR